MSTEFRIDGLDELMAALRALPKELASEASAIVERSARTAFNQISANYAGHNHTGKLERSMKLETERTAFGAIATVKNTDPIAYVFENGSVARHYITKRNGVVHVTGSMPPMHAFIPVMSRVRLEQMYPALKRMLEAHGLEVTGDATA